MNFEPGQIVGDYRIEAFIARGGFGDVWRVTHAGDGRACALKILRKKALAHPDVVKRFELEYSILSKLQHPSIVRVYDWGTFDVQAGIGVPWFTMDYYPFTLRHRIGQQVLPGEGVRLMLPVLEALDYAHKKNIAHRDLKPANILVDADGRSVLSDFGIAKKLDSNTLNLTRGMAIGTYQYMAPEQLTGKTPVGPASDLYAIGVILYQICTGLLPFQKSNAKGSVYLPGLTQEDRPKPLRDVVDSLSEQIEACVMKCLELEPPDRFASAEELRKELLRCPELKTASERIFTPGQLLPGKPYRVLGLIDQGGFAEVYRVKHLETGKVCALKMLSARSSFDEANVRRFRREIRILRTLDHPHIVGVVDDGAYTHNSLELPYFIMPYFPGTLQTAISEEFDDEKVFNVIWNVLEGLKVAHSFGAGVFHCDLKPSNILISGDGQGYLTDFGIAEIKERSIRTSAATQRDAATVDYAAPEQLFMNHDITASTDIYSMGVILYELVTRAKPFTGRTPAAIGHAKISLTPARPSAKNPRVSPALEAIILKCLDKEPEKRFANVGEMLEKLAQAKYDGRWFPDVIPRPIWKRAPAAALALARSPELRYAAASLAATVSLGAAAAFGVTLAAQGMPPAGAKLNVRSYNIPSVLRSQLAAAEPAPLPSVPSGALALNQNLLQVKEGWIAAGARAEKQSLERALASAAADPVLAERLGRRLEGLIASNLERPSIRVASVAIAGRTIESAGRGPIQTNESDPQVRVEFAIDGPADSGQIKYEFKEAGAAADLALSPDPSNPSAAIVSVKNLKDRKNLKIDLVARLASPELEKLNLPEYRAPDPVEQTIELAFSSLVVGLRASEGYRSFSLSEPGNFAEGVAWKLMKGGQLVSEAKLAPGDEFSLPANLTDGQYSVVAEASEKENPLVSGTESVDFRVDSTPPVLALADAAASAGPMILFADEPISVNIKIADEQSAGETTAALRIARGEKAAIQNASNELYSLSPPEEQSRRIDEKFLSERTIRVTAADLKRYRPQGEPPSGSIELRVIEVAPELVRAVLDYRAIVRGLGPESAETDYPRAQQRASSLAATPALASLHALAAPGPQDENQIAKNWIRRTIEANPADAAAFASLGESSSALLALQEEDRSFTRGWAALKKTRDGLAASSGAAQIAALDSALTASRAEWVAAREGVGYSEALAPPVAALAGLEDGSKNLIFRRLFKGGENYKNSALNLSVGLPRQLAEAAGASGVEVRAVPIWGAEAASADPAALLESAAWTAVAMAEDQEMFGKPIQPSERAPLADWRNPFALAYQVRLKFSDTRQGAAYTLPPVRVTVPPLVPLDAEIDQLVAAKVEEARPGVPAKAKVRDAWLKGLTGWLEAGDRERRLLTLADLDPAKARQNAETVGSNLLARVQLYQTYETRLRERKEIAAAPEADRERLMEDVLAGSAAVAKPEQSAEEIEGVLEAQLKKFARTPTPTPKAMTATPTPTPSPTPSPSPMATDTPTPTPTPTAMATETPTPAPTPAPMAAPAQNPSAGAAKTIASGLLRAEGAARGAHDQVIAELRAAGVDPAPYEAATNRSNLGALALKKNSTSAAATATGIEVKIGYGRGPSEQHWRLVIGADLQIQEVLYSKSGASNWISKWPAGR